MSAAGMIPPTSTKHVAATLLGQALDDTRHQRQVRPGEEGQPDGVGVLLDDRLHHLLGRLVQTGVDDLESRIPKGTGDDLRPTVVPVQPGLGHHDSIGALHGARY